MLTIKIGLSEDQWDEEREEFIEGDSFVLELEHSLVSLSKWESTWCKPFFSNEPKSSEETIDYIKCMTLTPNVDPEIYNKLTMNNIKEINEYIDRPMTATRINNEKQSKFNREIVTAELIYYWMIALTIPMECQYWHINRLLTLVKVCNIKNQPPKKMGKRDLTSHYASLNAARRQQLNTKG